MTVPTDTLIIASGAKRGLARSLAEQIERAQADETVGTLVAAFALKALRDRNLYTALGAKTLSVALGAKLPSLDRSSARQLLVVADTFFDEAPAKLVPLSLPKLLTIARAPAELHAELLAAGSSLPSGELARQVRELTERAGAIKLRAQMNAPAISPTTERASVKKTAGALEEDPLAALAPDERVRLANAFLADVADGWADMGTAAFEIGRLLAKLRDEKLGYLLYRDGADDLVPLTVACAEVFGLSATELERALDLADNLALVPLAERRRIGIHALRELAALDNAARREEVLKLIATRALAGDEAIKVAAAVANTLPNAASDPEKLTAPGQEDSWADDPARLAPYNMLFLADDESDSGFADATPAELIEQILLRYSRPGDLVLDLTAGSGTVAAVGTRMGRRVRSVDRLDPPMLKDIEVGDARKWIPEAIEHYTVVFFHPPTPGEVRYSERYSGNSLAGDLSLLDPEAFGQACAEVFKHLNRELLDKNGVLAIIGHESHAFGRFIDWPGKMSLVAERSGLALSDRINAVLGPAARRALERSTGFRARRENRTISVITSAIIAKRALGDGRQ